MKTIAMNVLVIDIGGSNVKILATGQMEVRRHPSGPAMTPAQMVSAVKELAGDWSYDAIAIGYPGRVRRGVIIADPHNLGPGWVGFDFEAAFKRPVKLTNDAAMQALGSYKGGTLLFLGFGTGLGSALVVQGVLAPMEFAHLPYKKRSIEDYVGDQALERLGRKKWEEQVTFAIERLMDVFQADDVVLGGGNAKRIKTLPAGCRLGDNANAFVGGFRLWEEANTHPLSNREGASKARKQTGRKGT